MATGDIIRMGTLWVGGVKQKRPVNPVQNGDCAEAWGSTVIELRGSDPDESFRVQWVEVNDRGKRLLICDRLLTVNTAWVDLNAQGLVMGKPLTLDGQTCILRLPTGGAASADKTNEWDRLVCGGESGLSTADSLWHWNGMFSWCQEVSASYNDERIARGSTAADRWRSVLATQQSINIGFRPVLEFVEGAPSISDSDRELGELTAPLQKTYAVSLSGAGSFTLREEADGVLLRELIGQKAGEFILDLTDIWGSLASNAPHTVRITATAGEVCALRQWTFRKVNRPPSPPCMLRPTEGCRAEPSGFSVFIAGADPEGDNQQFTLSLSPNAEFTGAVRVITAGLERLEGEVWTAADSASAADTGKRFRLPYADLPENGEYWLRVSACDTAGSGELAHSEAARVLVGTRLDFITPPQILSRMPLGIHVALNGRVDPKAARQIWAANNALDKTPAWEEITAEVLEGGAHVFANRTKTAGAWAAAVHVVLEARDADGEISLDAVGVGIA